MPNAVRVETPYQAAAGAVQAWLDGQQRADFQPSRGPDGRVLRGSWRLTLEHPVLGRQQVTLSLPPDFPARPAEVHLDRDLCLFVPHVEESGRLCHSIKHQPWHFQAPEAAVAAVIEDLQRLWTQTEDPAWVRQEFARESLSYWKRFCEQQQRKTKLPIPLEVRVAVEPFETPVVKGELALYLLEGRKKRPQLLVATMGEDQPHPLAVRHDWRTGTLVKGKALFVELPDDQSWLPVDWPRELSALERLVGQVTGTLSPVTDWVKSYPAKGKAEGNEAQPYVVVLVQAGICYGYMLSPAVVHGLTNPITMPVDVTRVDPNWSLARDHELDRLATRRSKRVLVLGCGSLGAPTAELLARGGVGEIHVLDREDFDSENCARHTLGANDIAASKATSLQTRLRRAVPGVAVHPHVALATAWLAAKCKPDSFDLVVDCTGEAAVRSVLRAFRKSILGTTSVVHGWLEPFGAAFHTILMQGSALWPEDDFGPGIDVAEWPEQARVEIPACNAGFHPYGAADAWAAAGQTAEKALQALDGAEIESTVWSSVRSQEFFDALPVKPVIRPGFVSANPLYDRVVIARKLEDLGHA